MRTYRFDFRDDRRVVYSSFLTLPSVRAALDKARELATEFDVEVWTETDCLGKALRHAPASGG